MDYRGLAARPTPPLFMDLEASSLRAHVSYPTEIAWSVTDGTIESVLIRPEPDWTDWSEQAEALTGISRKLLADEGVTASMAASLLNQTLYGQTVYVDGGAYDRFWLRRLFTAAGAQPSFDVEDMSELIPVRLRGCPEWADRLQELQQQAREQAGPAHRASSDVLFLRHLYQAVNRDTRNAIPATPGLPAAPPETLGSR
ncbi:MAG: hypothetical protein JJU06_19990 [Ectothiorhodospiraceae bacterium]|nr:hypothetical protein [Ectothiorhodospiraceae bacterium]